MTGVLGMEKETLKHVVDVCFPASLETHSQAQQALPLNLKMMPVLSDHLDGRIITTPPCDLGAVFSLYLRLSVGTA